MEKSIWNLGLLRVAETPSLCGDGGTAADALESLQHAAADRYIETEDEFRLWLCYCLDWNWERDKPALDRAVEAARALRGIDPEAVARENAQIVARLRWMVGVIEKTVRDAPAIAVFRGAHVADTFAAMAANKPRGGWQEGDPATRPDRINILELGYFPKPSPVPAAVPGEKSHPYR